MMVIVLVFVELIDIGWIVSVWWMWCRIVGGWVVLMVICKVLGMLVGVVLEVIVLVWYIMLLWVGNVIVVLVILGWLLEECCYSVMCIV